MAMATIARAGRLVALAAMLLCALSATLGAEEKSLKGVALVIGQSNYAHIAPLANPANDAREMVKLLSDLGDVHWSMATHGGGRPDYEKAIEFYESAKQGFEQAGYAPAIALTDKKIDL